MGKNSRANNRKKRANPVPKNEDETLELIARSFMGHLLYSIGKGNPENAIKICLEDEAESIKWCTFLDKVLGEIDIEGTKVAWQIEHPGPSNMSDPKKALMRLKLLHDLALYLKDEISPKVRVVEDKFPEMCVPECQ